MSKDKRVLRNQTTILNLQQLLIDICKYPEDFDVDFYKKALKSQGGLSKIEDKERDIVKSSINTLKRISPNVLENGFDELNELRIMALNALNNHQDPNNKSSKTNKTGLANYVSELEKQIDILKRANMLTMNALIEDISAFSAIKGTAKNEVTKKLAENAISRLNSFALLSPELIDIKEQGNVVTIEFGSEKDEK